MVVFYTLASLSPLPGSCHPLTGLNHSLYANGSPQQSTASSPRWPASPCIQLPNAYLDLSNVPQTQQVQDWTASLTRVLPAISISVNDNITHLIPRGGKLGVTLSPPTASLACLNHHLVWLSFLLEISPTCPWPQTPAAPAPIQASTICSWLFVAWSFPFQPSSPLQPLAFF